MRAGSRFPVRDADKTNYVDVGVNIDNHLEDVAGRAGDGGDRRDFLRRNRAGCNGGAPVIRQ